MLKPTINQIFAENADEYLKKYPNTPTQERKVIRSLSICRTADLGGRYCRCGHCGYSEMQYNSCRNRHCPQCQNMKKERWILERKSEVLPFTYFHNVFTLPHELNPIVYRNKKAIFKLFYACVKDVLFEVCGRKKYLDAKIGFFSIMHTWDQKLNQHYHMHCVIPGGGYSNTENKWVKAKKDFLVPAAVLKYLFRKLFIKQIKKMYADGILVLTKTGYEKPWQFYGLIKSLSKKKWVVYLKESFKSSNSVIEYLARYTHKIAITNHRIVCYKNGQVTFKYRDSKNRNAQNTKSVDALTFMRFFLLHVVPNRFVRIRYFGLLSHRTKSKAITDCRNYFNIKLAPEKKPDTWLGLMLMITGKDITLCPNCQKGHLVFIEFKPRNYRSPPVNIVNLRNKYSKESAYAY